MSLLRSKCISFEVIKIHYTVMFFLYMIEKLGTKLPNPKAFCLVRDIAENRLRKS